MGLFFQNRTEIQQKIQREWAIFYNFFTISLIFNATCAFLPFVSIELN